MILILNPPLREEGHVVAEGVGLCMLLVAGRCIHMDHRPNNVK